jgi:hypothetical protein
MIIKTNQSPTGRRRATGSMLAIATALSLCAPPALAQLTDLTQTPNTIGVGIGKSLGEQIGAGRGDDTVPESSLYIIARDPARAIRRGRQLFQRKFSADQGLGPRVNPSSSGDLDTHAAFGAGMVDSCAGCHGRPRGSAGVGGNVFTRPDSRDAPHLFGLGLVEMLADEITADLRAIQAHAIERAAKRKRSVRARLRSKGIDYGHLVAHPDGEVDTADVEGVDADLRVRPFFHEGSVYSMRSFIVGAFKDEMGLETADPDLLTAHAGGLVTTPSGLVLDGARDRIGGPPIEDGDIDGDGDDIIQEIDPALVDHLEFYLLNYFKPATGKMTVRAKRGLRTMQHIGCTDCHVQDLLVDRDRRVADVETGHDPERGIFNRLFATASTLFDVVEDGDPNPKLLPKGEPFLVRNIFADFKRHDLGPGFEERNFDGTTRRLFMTEPLWGVATTAPYGHDGRSINIEEVILRHGGEAEDSRNAFAALPAVRQDDVIAFLQTLVLFPPDDTASNLNPGVPGGDPQTEHGSIDLSQLFQIADSGPE